MSTGVPQLVDYYRKVYEERFRGLPIINPDLDVEAVGFRRLDEHEFGALITPWFINLVLLPGTDRWQDRAQGSRCSIELPGGKVDFTVSHDEELGTTLSAAMFGTVTDFPDQALARDVAAETLRMLFSAEQASESATSKTMSRRQLLRNLGKPESAGPESEG
jgi:[NiFe] hydrogenase assembly HybE family chaperone